MRAEAMRRAPDFGREVFCLLGLPIDAVDMAGAERKIRAAVANRSPYFLSTPNVNFLIACQADAAFRDSVLNSDLSVADGMPLVWLAGLIGIPIYERVAGASLFNALRLGRGEQMSVYFFGGPDGVAKLAGQKLQLEGKGLTCAGYESPGFGSIDEMSADAVIGRINASKADVLAVSIGAGKGQKWIERNRNRLNIPVVVYLGATLHFAAGTVRRAPAWMQRCGMEWLWRIKEEPSLWRRYIADGLALIALLVTRVLPYAWYSRRTRSTAEQLTAARIETQDEAQCHVLRLQGVWTHSNIARLRRCFYHAALTGKNVRLELGGVTHVDSAFIGLVMLLRGHQRRHGKQLLIASLPRAVRRVFWYCGAEYLCTGAAEAQCSSMVLDDTVLPDDVRP
jgi:N-acetylglucosaminyldiphosphoundecaprenol N-acetyl-beta-D-mannosaminyltransferase